MTKDELLNECNKTTSNYIIVDFIDNFNDKSKIIIQRKNLFQFMDNAFSLDCYSKDDFITEISIEEVEMINHLEFKTKEDVIYNKIDMEIMLSVSSQNDSYEFYKIRS